MCLRGKKKKKTNSVFGQQATTMTENIFDTYNVTLSDCDVLVGYQNLHSWIQQSVRKFEGGGPQYVAVDGVTISVLEQIDKNRSRLPNMRLYHDASSNRLLIKFVKTDHNVAASQFLAELMEGCQAERCQAVGITRKDFYSLLGSI